VLLRQDNRDGGKPVGRTRRTAGARTAAGCLLVALALSAPSGASAQTSPSADPARAAASDSSPAQSKPFGVLTLYALAGTLFVGLVIGVGLGSLRSRVASRQILPGRASPRQTREPAPAPAPLPHGDSAPSDEPEDEDDDVLPVLARMTLPFAVGRAPSEAVARLVDRLSRGPAYGPRIIAFANSASPGHEAMVIAQIAEAARQDDLDVIIVDAAETPDDEIVQELDLVVDASSGKEGRARIEIVPLDHLLPPGRRPGVSVLRKGLHGLAARTDVILVRTSDRPATPAIYGAVDEILLLRDARDPHGDDGFDPQADLARYRDRLAGMIVVTDRAA
jgi:hypothetical protein